MAGITFYHAHHDTDGEEGGNANIAKATAMVVLFISSFTIGCIPIKLNKMLKWDSNAKNNQYVKLLLGLGGGVLLCTTFIHLLPEVSEGFEDLRISSSIEIPYAELLMCTGFFVMYFVEECVHVFLHRKEKSTSLNVVRRSISIRRGEFEVTEKSDSVESPNHNSATSYAHNHSHGHHVDHSHVILEYSHNSTVVIIRGLLVVLALSIHELFEGLAVGLESSASTVWYMFGAVSAHKLVIAFCIGVDLVASGIKTFIVVIYIFTFAIVSPLGIGLGLVVTNMEQSSTATVSVILQGLATGTLLYVVFFEILQAEKKSGLLQYAAILLGFVIMFGITLIDQLF